MAKLQGKMFFLNSNTGVTAITPRDDSGEIAELTQRLCDYYGTLGLTEEEYVNAVGSVLMTVFCKPVFAFARKDRVESSPWFTGDEVFLEKLCEYIREEGGIIQDIEFYVPFAKGYELGIHGIKALQDEIRWITTDAEFEEEFGISRQEILSRTVPM